MPNPEANPPISPTVVEAGYQDEVSFTVVKANGKWDAGTLVAVNEVPATIDTLKKNFGPDLAWISHWKTAVVTVRHDSSLQTPSPAGLGNLESVTGGRIESAPAEFAVGFKEGEGVELVTAEEILVGGMLSDFMRKWIRNVAVKSNFWSAELDQFLPLYPSQPDNKYKIS